MLEYLQRKIKTTLIKAHVIDYANNNKQLYHLTVSYRNCIKFYVNDVLVQKQNTYLTSSYKDSNTIKLKLIGLFNNQTHFISVDSISVDVNIPLFANRKEKNAIESIKKLSHNKFHLTSIDSQRELISEKTLEKITPASISKSNNLLSKLSIKNYNLTNIKNYYEQ